MPSDHLHSLQHALPYLPRTASDFFWASLINARHAGDMASATRRMGMVVFEALTTAGAAAGSMVVLATVAFIPTWRLRGSRRIWRQSRQALCGSRLCCSPRSPRSSVRPCCQGSGPAPGRSGSPAGTSSITMHFDTLGCFSMHDDETPLNLPGNPKISVCNPLQILNCCLPNPALFL